MVGVALAPVSPAAAAALNWSPGTAADHTNTYERGDQASFVFTATGFSSAQAPTLQLRIVDAEERVIGQQQLSLTAQGDSWQARFTPQTQQTGFFRIYATAVGGSESATLPAMGTMPAGYLTYVVVPSVSARPPLSEDNAFFGMQGGFSGNTTSLIPMLGIRWLLASLRWDQTEPDHHQQLVEKFKASAAGPSDLSRSIPFRQADWKTYPLPTLFFRRPAWAGSMDKSSFGKAWEEYCRNALSVYKASAIELPKRIYQITWEPDLDPEFKNDASGVFDLYKAAYPVIHSLDPAAVVIGPTRSNIDAGSRDWNNQLIKQGLLQYLDGWAVHPYNRPDSALFMQQQLDQLRSDMQALGGKQVPIYATEHGRRTNPDAGDELKQARFMVESNIVLLGEGAPMAMSFYIHDGTGQSSSGFGIYYNLNTKISFGTDRVAPKPVAGAYAAMTSLLEGGHPTGRLSPGAGLMGYQLTRGGGKIYVVWSAADEKPHAGRLSCEGSLNIYDWMGNKREQQYKCGSTQSFGPDPVYLTSD
ncbi:MAG TPA: hypothetical protein VFA75_10730 [Nevskia sp.]|nr:hypothetical protein [Nevskia sp.]